MKLISVKILGEKSDNFRSLQANKDYVFKQNSFIDAELNQIKDVPGIAKMVFTGLNGSGKSNFLQFIAEAFDYIYSRNTIDKLKPEDTGYGFEIIYAIYLTPAVAREIDFKLYNSAYVLIKIKKEPFKQTDAKKGRRTIKTDKNFEYEISVKKNETEGYLKVNVNKHLVLPNKIVGYSSGHNEVLSNPFYRYRLRSFLEMDEISEKEWFNDRMIFLDYTTSQYVFVANLLLTNHDKLKHLTEQVGISTLNSFRITINYKDYKRYKIKIPPILNKQIELLKQCATIWIHKKPEDVLILDFVVDKATNESFSHYFKTSFNLFRIFLQLHYLNSHAMAKDLRAQSLRSPKWTIFADELGKEQPHLLPFRLEKIQLDKIISHEPLQLRSSYYRSLSDGEHQFLHLIGTVMLFEEGNVLYLFDEPETHFNPQWKYDYFRLLDAVASEVDSEVLLTTHDPVLISGIKKEQLLMFKKLKNGEVTITNPEKDLIGMGVEAILTSEIFGFETTLDKETQNKLVERRKLIVKSNKEALSENEIKTLRLLSEELSSIDYANPVNDNMYLSFIENLGSLDIYKKAFLNPEEKNEILNKAKEAIKKISSK